MDEYYQNGPLPTWLGLVRAALPALVSRLHGVLTLGVELVLVWAVFLPRRFRLACFAVVTALQIGIIATANYAFLNYLVLVLGVLLLDDALLVRLRLPVAIDGRTGAAARRAVALGRGRPCSASRSGRRSPRSSRGRRRRRSRCRRACSRHSAIANAYGLFAVMTEARYEIEFQGSRDGVTWMAYPFRYKPQDPYERPGIYAPYQPRFDWNLWFASLGPWQQSSWVVLAQQRLLENSPSVLRLFRSNPFAAGPPPALVRTVRWQYWFTDRATKRRTGAWWRRREFGMFTGSSVGNRGRLLNDS